MEFKIKNPELQKFDQEMFHFNSIYTQFLNILGKVANPFAYSQIMEKLKQLEEKLSAIKVTDEFDKLLKEHFEHTLETQKLYADFFSKKDSGIKFDTILKNKFGPDALNIVKDIIKNYDYQHHWSYFLFSKDIYSRVIQSDEESVRERIKELLAQLKPDIIAYAQKNLGFPEEYDFDLVLAPPYQQQTYWNPDIRRMVLSGSEFLAFMDQGVMKINPCMAIVAIFHELFGHGLQTLNSLQMPFSLQSRITNSASEVSGPVIEGVALFMEQEAFKFMEKSKEKYKVEDDFITFARYGVETRLNSSAFFLFYHYLRFMKEENPDLDIESEFLKHVDGNYGLWNSYKYNQTNPAMHINTFQYFTGLQLINRLLTDLKKRHGDDFIEKNKAKVIKAMATGIWSWKVYPKFIEYCLKQ